MPVLYGLFIYMGVSALRGVQVVNGFVSKMMACAKRLCNSLCLYTVSTIKIIPDFSIKNNDTKYLKTSQNILEKSCTATAFHSPLVPR